LVGRGGQLVGQVAQVVFDLAEGLALRQIDEPFGHAAEDLLGAGPEAPQELLDPRLAVVGGTGEGSRRGVSHGACPGMAPRKRFEFPTSAPGYLDGSNFSPTFAKHTRTPRV
jgi:hypothetical protein